MFSRALGRNVHIYSARDTNTILGSLFATNGMANANFYSMVEIAFIFDNDYTLSSESGATVQRGGHPLQAGKYFINTAGSLRVNNEPLLSHVRSGRALGRNVYIYSARDINTILGSLFATNSMTNANFYSMVEIAFIFDNDYTLSSESGATVQRDNHPLQAGKYLINTASSLRVNDEPLLFHTRSVAPQSFVDAVRERDNRCVITGEHTLDEAYGNWSGFRVTPIFPLAHEQHWVTQGYDKWITVPGSRASGISSVQNGLLLREDMSSLFEAYLLSINPDDGYKIVSFMRDSLRIAGTHLDKAFLEHPKRPVDELLRWHFRQAALANVARQGELCFNFN